MYFIYFTTWGMMDKNNCCNYSTIMMATHCDFKNTLHLTVRAKSAPRTIIGTGLSVAAADGDADERTRAGLDSVNVIVTGGVLPWHFLSSREPSRAQ